MYFKLIGNRTLFRAVETYNAAGFIPSVRGITLDGRRQTCARLVDIEALPEIRPGERPEAA